MTRHHGGLGLGLAIVKEVTELHNGSVSAASAGPGRGATFTVRLPQLISGAQPDEVVNGHDASRVAPQLRWSGVRILAVDDDADSLEVVRAALTLTGAEVRTASSASERSARGNWSRAMRCSAISRCRTWMDFKC
jgi:hypothetical protein